MTASLTTIIDRAKARGAVLTPPGRLVVAVRIDGAPSHLMTNAVAAFQSELEDLFLRRLELIGGGAGCLMLQFDLGTIPVEEESRIASFLDDGANQEYFQQRYGITSMAVKRTPRYT